MFIPAFATEVQAGCITYRQVDAVKLPPSEQMTHLYFDHFGLMWIGTVSGLKSWDGYTMHTYRSDAFTPGILPNNSIVSIVEDHDDLLWVGTRNGLVCMDRRKGTFKTYHLPGETRKIIYQLFVSKDGTLWVGTDGGLSEYDRKNDRFINYETDLGSRIRTGKKLVRPERAFSVKSIVESHDGRYLFIGTWKSGVLRLRRGTSTFDCYRHPNGDHRAFALHLDEKNRLWVGTWGSGVACITNPFAKDFNAVKTLRFKASDDFDEPLYNMVADKPTGTLWACYRNGVGMLRLDDIEAGFCYDRTTSGMQNNWMTTDPQGNIWLQKRYNEIQLIDTRPSMFKQLFREVPQKPFCIHSVFSIYTDDGRYFWLALMPFGIAYYDRLTGKALFNKEIPSLRSLPDVVLNTATTCITRLRNGELWMANNSYGIVTIKPGQQARLIDKIAEPIIPDNFANSIMEHNDGTVWVGTREGLVIFGRNRKVYRLRLRSQGRDISNCDVRHICQSRDGTVWLATENEGIIRLRKNKAGQLVCRQYAPTAHNFAVEDATACHEDKRGNLWAISNSGGLFLYDKQTDGFEPMNRRYHIYGDKVYAINEDAQGNLWLTTDKSLTRLTFTDGHHELRSYSSEDGIGELLFPTNSTAGHAGELYFGNGHGFVAFNPAEAARQKTIAQRYTVVVTDISIDDQPYSMLDSVTRQKLSKETPEYTRELTIPSSVDKFTVDFAILDYSNASQNKCAYLLEGYNEHWQYLPPGTHSASFENISSGTYTLRLKASNNLGAWKEMSYTIKVKVLPPWWATWWAYLLYLMAGLAAVYLGSYWYKEHLKTKNRLHMAVVFTNIAHELLTPLTVMSASVDSLNQKAPQYRAHYDMIQGNISRLVRLLRQILEVRKAQAGQLKLKVAKGDLTTFLQGECEMVRPLIEKKGLTLQIDIQPIIGYFDPDKLDTILQNLLSNSIKYSVAQGYVSVKAVPVNSNVEIIVADNGIGMSKDKMKHLYQRFLDGDYRRVNTFGTGIGLSLTHDLVGLHHGRIDCKSEEGKGTTFTVTIPIDRYSYQPSEIDESIDMKVRQTEVVTDLGFTKETIERTDEDNQAKEHSLLIVEDNTELLTLMRNLLSKRYNVYTAKDGQKALSIICRKDLDLVVSDVMMPVMDGVALTRQIKNNPDTAQLPVILLTAKTADEDRNEAYSVGADVYMTKPFKIDDLLLRIENIIANRERIRRKFSSQTEFNVEEQHYSSPDETFVQKAIDCVKAHLGNSNYDRDSFASDMCVSESTLYNKLRALTGQNVTGFINSIRLKEACKIARRNPHISITELSMKVGFGTPKYFSKCFKKEFGMLLREYLEREGSST